MKVHNNTTHSVVLPRKTAANNAKDLAKSLVADAVKATISDEGKRLNQKIYHDDGLPATESVLADRDAKKKDIAAKKERISDLMDKLSSDDLTDKDKSIITDEIEKLRKESTTTEDKLYALYDSKAVWEKRKDSSSGDAAVALGVIDFYQKEIDKTKDILDKEARDDSKNQLKAVQERADKEAEEKKTPVAESQDVGVETLRQADISTLKAENGLLENIAKEKS
ncbi:MAG: hypothetical protein E7202_13300 [Selenomonas ruminantium]|nr:hypothetical protein [Selenomonas ruminantium]